VSWNEPRRWKDAVPAPSTVAGLLTLAVISAVLASTGLYLSEHIAGPQGMMTAAATERLLLAIDNDGRRRVAPERLAADLPAPIAVPGDVSGAIRDAAATVGVDAGFMIAVAAKESAFHPGVRAAGSSAAGLYQFTETTWLRAVKIFGARHGLADFARAITLGDNGAVALPEPVQRERLMRLRGDVRIAALMAAELALDNQRRLEHLLGRPASPAEIYIGHFLGVAQAARLIEAAHSAPNTSGTRLLPAAAQSNPTVFQRDGQEASAAAIVGRIEAYFDREATRPDKI
jgi:hypothetical protein